MTKKGSGYGIVLVPAPVCHILFSWKTVVTLALTGVTLQRPASRKGEEQNAASLSASVGLRSVSMTGGGQKARSDGEEAWRICGRIEARHVCKRARGCSVVCGSASAVADKSKLKQAGKAAQSEERKECGGMSGCRCPDADIDGRMFAPDCSDAHRTCASPSQPIR
eukprot:1422535-Rhodomonas_salina.1